MAGVGMLYISSPESRFRSHPPKKLASLYSNAFNSLDYNILIKDLLFLSRDFAIEISND